MKTSHRKLNESDDILMPIKTELNDLKTKIDSILSMLGDKSDEECEDEYEEVEIVEIPESKNSIFLSLTDFLNEAEKKHKGKCPASGCVKKVGDKWRVISNRTGKLWPAHYDTREDAEDALAAYHIH